MIEMNIAPIKSVSKIENKNQYEISIEMNEPGISDWVRVPVGASYIIATVIIDVGAAKIQTTNDLEEKIENNTAFAEDWPAGIITVTTEKTAKPPKAFRLVTITGAAKLLGGAY